jgi:hypothetical protein
VAAAFGDCDSRQVVVAIREVPGLQTTLGDLAMQLEALKNLLA